MMPSESEHKLEGLLRAWSKQRREEAGKKFELHPATRRLLLSEVVRCYPKRIGQRTPWRLAVSRIWQTTVGVVGLFVLLAVIGWAGFNFWGNLPRYGDAGQDEIDPPEQTSFTLRKRPVDERRRVLLAANGANRQPASKLDRAKEAPATEAAAGTDRARLKETATASLDKAAAVEISRSSESARGGGDIAGSSEKAVATDPNPFRLAPAGTRLGNAFKPVMAPDLATGSVAAITESLMTAAKPGARPASPAPVKDRPVDIATRKTVMDGKDLAMKREVSGNVAPAATTSPAVNAPLPVSAPAGLGGTASVASSPAGDRGIISTSADHVLLSSTAEPMPAKRSLSSVLPLAAPAEPPKAGLVFERLADESRLADQKQKAMVADRIDGAGRQEDAWAAAFGGRLRDESARVLRRFELRQDGSKVTLIDADGSTYEGYVSPTNLSEGKVALAKALALAEAPKFNVTADADKLERQAGSVASGTAATTASYFFRVAGTNQTLREAVSLAGSLSTNTLRLEGKLRIGTNAEQPLKAVRAP